MTINKQHGVKRVLIIGAGKVAQQLAAGLALDARYHVVGFVDDQYEQKVPSPWTILGSRHDTLQIVHDHSIDEVIVTYAPTWQQHLAERLEKGYPGVNLRIVPSSLDALLRLDRIESFGDIATVQLARASTKITQVVKRTFDVLVASALLAGSMPLLILIGVLIKLTSPGPVLFSQQRVGRYGKTFNVHKLRTMVHNAEGKTGPILSTGKTDARLTKLGYWLWLFRIDEIPQLWNVLCREMSLVGPRPERPYFVQQFNSQIPNYAQRHEVRPGITGLAQVYGGYHTDVRDKLRFDLIYVAQHSLWLDLCILVKTLGVIVTKKGGASSYYSVTKQDIQTIEQKSHYF